MLRITKTIMYTLLIVLTLFSCDFKRNENLEGKLPLPRKVLIFPDSANVKNTDTALISISSKLGLVSIRNGFDSFHLRLWYSSLDTVHVVSIAQTKYEKTGRIISYVSEVNANRDSVWINIYRDEKGVQPKSGWDSLFIEINRNKIQLLPEMDSITNRHHDFTGGTAFTFEIATLGKYRNFTYYSPQHITGRNKLWQITNVVTFLKFINRQFNLPPLEKWPGDADSE